MTDSFCCFAHCSIAANIFNSNVCATSCQNLGFPSAFEIPPPPPLNILSMPTMTVYASQISQNRNKSYAYSQYGSFIQYKIAASSTRIRQIRSII